MENMEENFPTKFDKQTNGTNTLPNLRRSLCFAFLLQSMDCGDKMIRYSLLQSYYGTAIGLLPAAVLRLPLHSYRFQKIKNFVFLRAISCIHDSQTV